MWGRTITPNQIARCTMLGIFLFAPLLCLGFAVVNVHYGGSFATMWTDFDSNHFFTDDAERWDVAQVVSGWLGFQLVLALLPDYCSRILPLYVGGIQRGQRTPSGKILRYNINGLQAWILTMCMFTGGVGMGWIDPGWIVKRWLSLFYCANVVGHLLAFFAYFKAKTFPTYPKDNKETGDSFYDMIMGIEFNPRLFGIDLKLFFNGRPGIIGWSVLNLCFLFTQYRNFGTVTNAMMLVNVLQGLYVVDFFWNERWYLKTLDIAHDHFGFYLAWGDCVWLPFMYTLQGLYLVHNPVVLEWWLFMSILTFGVGGYVMFRWSNYQKDIFRRLIARRDRLSKIAVFPESAKRIMDDWLLRFWGKKATYIQAKYHTLDGIERTSYLLTSGFWGQARHMNYTGDMILSLMWCVSCGFTHILPYFYFFYIVALLVTRTFRDETRCRGKYGEDVWNAYCEKVPYRFIPYIY